MSRQLHLALFVSHAGSHLAGWRLPEAQAGHPLAIDDYRRLAEKAEAARLDLLFVADKLALDDIHGGSFDAAVNGRSTTPRARCRTSARAFAAARAASTR